MTARIGGPATHANATDTVLWVRELDQDESTNRAIREVASTPSAQHLIPAEVVTVLYKHVDQMRAELFAGKIPEVVLSFDVSNRRILGHYSIFRNGIGVRWAVNLNPVHLARPVHRVLGTLLHELAHAWQHGWGTPAKPPHHNRELRTLCEKLGIPTDRAGHDLGVRLGTPFEAYCRRHGVSFPSSVEDEEGRRGAPPPLVPAPPATPRGSKLRKWSCKCGVNVRVAVLDFDARCNRCGTRFVLVG